MRKFSDYEVKQLERNEPRKTARINGRKFKIRHLPLRDLQRFIDLTESEVLQSAFELVNKYPNERMVTSLDRLSLSLARVQLCQAAAIALGVSPTQIDDWPLRDYYAVCEKQAELNLEIADLSEAFPPSERGLAKLLAESAKVEAGVASTEDFITTLNRMFGLGTVDDSLTVPQIILQLNRLDEFELGTEVRH
jgi:hypothetical protein